MIDEIVAVFIEEYRMVPRKTWVSKNFGPMSKSGKRFLWVSKSRFRVIFASWVFDFFYQRISESRICRFLFPFDLQESKFFRDHCIAYRTEPCRLRQ